MLEYTTRKYTSFAITMRKTMNPRTVKQDDYVNQMNYFIRALRVKFDHVTYEQTAGIHMHGIIRIPTDVSLNRFRVRGWSIKLEEIYDYQGWLKYINKDLIEDDDLTITPKDEQFEIPKIKLFVNI